VQKRYDFTVGPGLGLPVNQGHAGSIESVKLRLKVRHRIRYVVQALSALF
jgi:hypothetical protein